MVLHAIAAAIVLSASLSGAGQAAEARSCLTREQARAAVAAKQVVPLGVARQAVRGEVIKARLCQGPKGLVYVLTLLGRDGKVTRARVDATSGKLAETRQ
jgi:uncharacterized membrane protein YkoI